MALSITSTAFAHQSGIPAQYTCQGADLSPPLAWSGAPAGTKSFALIVDDPDAPDPKAPKMTWVHWVLYDIGAGTASLAEGAKPSRVGTNDWKKASWGGPCPPIGRHRYFFKLYALDVVLGDRGALTKPELEKVIEGHVLAKAELVGTYQKH